MRVEINQAGIRMLDSRQILGQQMLDRATRARNQAARIAPKDTGTYAATLWARKSRGKFSTAVYGSSEPYARFIEYGSRVQRSNRARDADKPRGTWRIKPHHTLYNAAVQTGLRVRRVRG